MLKGFPLAALKVFLVRVVLGLFFASVIKSFFFPKAGIGTILAAAALLVFSAYLFESMRER
jgi:hypothetical protein